MNEIKVRNKDCYYVCDECLEKLQKTNLTFEIIGAGLRGFDCSELSIELIRETDKNITALKTAQLNKIKNLPSLRFIKKRVFLNAWKALAFLNTGLHPDEVDDWPEDLKNIGLEAWRRYKSSELKETEFWVYRDCMFGIEVQNPERCRG